MLLENVQKRFIGIVFRKTYLRLYQSDYITRIKIFNLELLVYYTLSIDLILYYKIVFGFIDITILEIFQFAYPIVDKHIIFTSPKDYAVQKM